jgi:hypothetical protein
MENMEGIYFNIGEESQKTFYARMEGMWSMLQALGTF